MMNKFKVLITSLICSCLFFAACGEQEEPPLVVVDSGENVVSYSLIQVSKDTVIKTEKIDCHYSQTEEQEVCFDVTGKFVEKVYVREGDSVKKGDVLCELASSSLEEEISELEYKVKYNELTLEHLDTKEALDIQDAWLSGFPMDNASRVAQIDGIKAGYDKQRQSINDDLEFDRLELEQKRTELRNSKVYAQIDGVVYKLQERLEGSTSRKDQVVMKIVNKSKCVFETDNLEGMELFSEGTRVEMKIVYSSAAGDYELLPLNMNEWSTNGKMQFEIYSQPDGAEIEVGVLGTINVISEKREDVLTLPREVVHKVGDEAFVYILTDDNYRGIKYVTVGLWGDTNVEIVDGMAEGDKVVKK